MFVNKSGLSHVHYWYTEQKKMVIVVNITLAKIIFNFSAREEYLIEFISIY